MKKTVRSLGYSIIGLTHAMKSETNLRRFVLLHILILLIGIWFHVNIFLLLITSVFAGLFMSVELLNTAIERLADTVDDIEKKHHGGHDHSGIRLTKDTAAAASLIALIVYVVIVILGFLPYVLSRLHIL